MAAGSSNLKNEQINTAPSEILATYCIPALLTTLTEDYDFISMHDVRRVLLEQQAASLGFPLEIVFIAKKTSNEEYEMRMERVLARYKNADITAVVFGDVFLNDLRKYREDYLTALTMKGIFPIWKRDTRELAHSLFTLGFKMITTCPAPSTSRHSGMPCKGYFAHVKSR